MFKTLIARLTLLLAAFILIITLLLLIVSNTLLENQLKQKKIDELKSRINLTEKAINSFNDSNSRLEFLKKIKDEFIFPDYNLFLLDRKKNLIFHTAVDSILIYKNYKVLDSFQSGKFVVQIKRKENGNKEFLEVRKEIDKVRIGNFSEVEFIVIESSFSEIQELLKRMRVKILSISFLVFIVGFLAIKFFLPRFLEPINRIIESIKEYSKTGKIQQIEPTGSNEFKLLIDHFNQIIKKIDHDLNELKKLEKYRTEFLGNVSHELRTPIFTIQSYLETLIDGGLNDPNINLVYLKRAYENLERLNRLLGDLIDISQIETRQMRFSFRYFSLDEMLQKVVNDLMFFANQKGIVLKLKNDENLKELVWGDRERLYQVFYNLIDNSIRHNPSNTIVEIYYQKLDSRVRIFVQDNGVGIPQEDLPRIFERFYRVDKERSRQSGGTGLGLAIVKHIVEAHGSKICVESKLNQGSKFYFDLKIA